MSFLTLDSHFDGVVKFLASPSMIFLAELKKRVELHYLG